jgi:hypothetical protein
VAIVALVLCSADLAKWTRQLLRVLGGLVRGERSLGGIAMWSPLDRSRLRR